MTKRPLLFGLQASPTTAVRVLLALIPFIVVVVVYFIASDIRHRENPADKLLPSFEQMGSAIKRVAFTEDKRTGKYLLWADTLSSLRRLAIGLGLATITALLIGLNIGAFPGMGALMVPFVTFLATIPPLAILPILFISFGIGEVGKVALIFIGTFPLMTRDIYMAVRNIPKEQITKALTLGAGPFAVVYKVLLPQIIPRLISSLRLSLGAAWLFIIAAEAIASTDGLGYRIFLMRRYLSMDIIIPYVIWITLLGFSFDYFLKTIVRYRYRWYLSD